MLLPWGVLIVTVMCFRCLFRGMMAPLFGRESHGLVTGNVHSHPPITLPLLSQLKHELQHPRLRSELILHVPHHLPAVLPRQKAYTELLNQRGQC
jgi:hypothetical protein